MTFNDPSQLATSFIILVIYNFSCVFKDYENSREVVLNISKAFDNTGILHCYSKFKIINSLWCTPLIYILIKIIILYLCPWLSWRWTQHSGSFLNFQSYLIFSPLGYFNHPLRFVLCSFPLILQQELPPSLGEEIFWHFKAASWSNLRSQFLDFPCLIINLDVGDP